MPVINGVYLKDFTALPSSVTDANIIPIAITGNQIAYRTTVGGIVTDARVTSKLLTGLSVTGGAIASTDTILQAFGKVQNQINSKVSSVGLTMPSAFNVANSPITSAGTLAVTAAGVASQYIRGDGALADFPTNGGGGSSVAYYLNGSVNQGTFVGNTYYEMNKTPVIGTGTDFTISSNGYIAQFITDANDPASLLIPAGNWNVEMYFSASSNGGTPSFYVEVYKYNGTTFTLLGTSSATPEGITNGTAIDIYYTSVGIPETVLTITDRLAIRVYVTNSGRTITLHTEDNHLSEIITTFSNGINTLNGLTKQAQYFAVGSAGSDFAIVSSVDTHTFNIPDASATARGLITIGTQTIAGAKTLTSTLSGVAANWSGLQSVSIGDAIGLNVTNSSATNSAAVSRNNGGGNIHSFLNSSGGVSVINTNGLLQTATGLSTEFLKANGTVDSTTYQGAITLTTTGTSGPATLVGNTLNVPNYADGGVLSLSAIGAVPNANAATITGTVLNLQPASASFGGVVTTGTQTFAGDKTLTGTLYGIGLSMTGTVADIVQGTATSGKALRGTATTGWGLYASATTGVGVQGNSSGTGGTGVYGSSGNGYGGAFANNSTTYPALWVNNNEESAGDIAVFQWIGSSIFTVAPGNSTFNTSVTGRSFIPTFSTVPTNGMYLSAANTLNFSTNSSNRFSISSTGAATFTGALVGTTASFTGAAATPITAINTGQRELGLFRTSLDGGFMTFQSSGATSRGYLGNGGGISSAGETSFGIRSESDLILMSGGNNIRLTIASTGAATFSGNIVQSGTSNIIQQSASNSYSGGSVLDIYNISATGYGVYIKGGGTSQYALSVNNYAGTNLFTILGSGAATFSNFNGAALYGVTINSNSNTGTQYMMSFDRIGVQAGYIASTSSTTAGIFNSSDYRIKEDLQPFNGIDKLMSMKFYDFKWKSDEGFRDYGVIAHELQEVLPMAVIGEKDGEKNQAVDYAKLIPIMAKAIQELKAEIDLLKGIAPIEPTNNLE